MVNRLRTGWLAGSGALVLVLAFSGVAMGAPLVTETTATFEDVNGDGVDDDCQEAAVEDTEAAAAAFAAADLNGDGEISVEEAAQSGWTGGVNCNHGGYVSQVAQADDEACAEPESGDTGETGDEVVDEEADEADCEATDEETADAEVAEEEACEEVAAPEPETPLDPTAPNSHGAWVSWVAGSEATGGKNCNHGGAVSEAAKKDQEAAKAERAAAKAERDAAKAERKAARDLKKQEREAARAAKGHGKPN
jgi:EF hand